MCDFYDSRFYTHCDGCGLLIDECDCPNLSASEGN